MLQFHILLTLYIKLTEASVTGDVSLYMYLSITDKLQLSLSCMNLHIQHTIHLLEEPLAPPGSYFINQKLFVDGEQLNNDETSGG